MNARLAAILAVTAAAAIVVSILAYHVGSGGRESLEELLRVRIARGVALRLAGVMAPRLLGYETALFRPPVELLAHTLAGTLTSPVVLVLPSKLEASDTINFTCITTYPQFKRVNATFYSLVAGDEHSRRSVSYSYTVEGRGRLTVAIRLGRAAPRVLTVEHVHITGGLMEVNGTTLASFGKSESEVKFYIMFNGVIPVEFREAIGNTTRVLRVDPATGSAVLRANGREFRGNLSSLVAFLEGLAEKVRVERLKPSHASKYAVMVDFSGGIGGYNITLRVDMDVELVKVKPWLYVEKSRTIRTLYVAVSSPGGRCIVEASNLTISSKVGVASG